MSKRLKTPAALLILLAALLIFTPAPARAGDAPGGNTLYQVSTLEALLAGIYDGQATVAQLKTHGSLGLGTFNALDGEMVVIDGVVYQVTAAGKVNPMPPTAKTPFANVVRFAPETTLVLEDLPSIAALEAALRKNLPSPNLIYAFRISGRFAHIKARSVPAQIKPYPPLIQVVKHQSVWQWQNIEGDLVGFYFPPYLKGLNVSGFHLHFISKDRTRGGHLLEVALHKTRVQVDLLSGLDLALPTSGPFLTTPLGKDTAKAVHQVER